MENEIFLGKVEFDTLACGSVEVDQWYQLNEDLSFASPSPPRVMHGSLLLRTGPFVTQVSQEGKRRGEREEETGGEGKQK